MMATRKCKYLKNFKSLTKGKERKNMATMDVKIDPLLLQELVVGDITYRSACDFRITAADFEKSRNELQEREEDRQSSLKNLREMLARDKHIRYRVDDSYLLRFLRYRKFDVIKAYKSIHKFYTMRNERPLLFTMPSDFCCEFFNLMPYVNEDGMLLFINKFAEWNPAELSICDILNMFCYVSDVMTMNPHAQIDGVMNIFDFGGTTAIHLSAIMNLSSLRLWASIVQDAYPWRVKKTVFFNCHSLVYGSLSLLRYFLKKKISDRLVILRSDLDELHKHINPDILPKEYGGILEEEECFSYLKKVLLSNKNYLEYENSYIGCRK